MEWLEPWESITESQKRYFEQELESELPPGHKLSKVKAEAIGKHGGSGNVLFKLEGETHPLAVVHLTFQKETNSAYPYTEFYKDWADFRENRMKEDNFGYQE